ncbi:alpha/beta fold hydrolase [Pleurocapsa sp. FMAR1]|uniref:alpha/beta fold hydrolase n=1 Tax=Pleurocapsa sp. FMAR1 TaxID=3040204 RepID=UPI0029C946C2|nr:alpha/beta hydrolase [Pleurocapsa sp. FMAR1]
MPSINILETPHVYELTAPVDNLKQPILVFVHGWLLSRHYWQPIVELLKSEYQCLIYDARGFGESIATKAPTSSNTLDNHYSLSAYAQDLKYLLENLEIKQAWVIGHSLGGSVALWSADMYPQVIKGVICLNSGGGIYLKEEFERFRNAGQQLVKFRPGWLRNVPLLDVLFSRMMVARPLKLKWGRQRIIDFIQADEKAALGALLESTTETEVHLLPQLVSRLKQPVYFIAGEKDRVMEIKYVNHLASFHQLFTSEDSNVFEIPNCGHLAMIEASEEVFAIITKVLNKYRV